MRNTPPMDNKENLTSSFYKAIEKDSGSQFFSNLHIQFVD